MAHDDKEGHLMTNIGPRVEGDDEHQKQGHFQCSYEVGKL